MNDIGAKAGMTLIACLCVWKRAAEEILREEPLGSLTAIIGKVPAHAGVPKENTMTSTDHRTDDHPQDAPEETTPGIPAGQESVIDQALRAEDEADEAAASATVAHDEHKHDQASSK